MKTSPRTSWLRVFALWLCGVGAGLQFAKASVVFDSLAARYEVGPTTAGWLVSAVGVVGILFGATAGIAVARIGARRALVYGLAGGALLAGIETALPPLPLFFACRLAEGASQLAIVVAAPSAIAAVAGTRHRAFALGLWSTFFSAAFIVGGAVAPSLMRGFGLAGVFGAHALAMAALALLAAHAAPAAEDASRAARGSLGALIEAHRQVYRDARTGTPAAAFLCYTGMFLALQTLTPALAPPDERQAILVGTAFISIATSLAAGAIAERWLSLFRLTALCFIAALAASALLHGAVAAGVAITPAALLRMGLVSMLPGAIYPMIPQLCGTPDLQARAFGALAQTGNLGSALGPPLFASSMALAGPIGLFVPTAALCIAGAVIAVWAGRRFDQAPVA